MKRLRRLAGWHRRLEAWLLSRKRGILLEGGSLDFVEVKRSRKGWILSRHRKALAGDLDKVLAEEGLMTMGAQLATSDQPLFLVPPSGNTEAPKILQSSSLHELVFEAVPQPKVGGWWRQGDFDSKMQEHAAWCDAAMPMPFLLARSLDAQACPLQWCALRVWDRGAFLWLLNRDEIRHGCGLDGGLQDLPLLRRELDTAFQSLEGERADWKNTCVAPVSPADRINELLLSLERGICDVPWRKDLLTIKDDARWVTALAVTDPTMCIWENWSGPAHKESRSVNLALRLGLGFLAFAILLAGADLARRYWVSGLERQVAQQELLLSEQHGWLRSLDSLDRSGANLRDNGRAESMAAIANCTSPELRLLAWKSADQPSRHTLEILAESEPAWLAMKACLETTGLFSSVALRSIEFRKNALTLERARIFAELRER